MKQSSQQTTKCSLCGLEANIKLIIDESNCFCCIGCQVVYTILTTKKQLDNYKENPLFQQALKTGLISNPYLKDSWNEKKIINNENYKKITLEIREMWCPSCAEVIKLFLSQKKGILQCYVDYSTDLGVIVYDPIYISLPQIEKTIINLGYQPHSLDNPSKSAISKSLIFRFVIALFCSLNVMMFSYPIYSSYFDADVQRYDLLFGWLSFVISVPVLFYSGWPIISRFFVSLKSGLLGMETLVMLGVGSAFFLSLYELLKGSEKVYFDSMTVIILFVLLGKILESKAKFSAKSSLFHLQHALPRKGRKRFENGSQRFISVKDFEIGDIAIACAGERIVLDGLVIEGVGCADESLMTGEAKPIEKEKGSIVIAGSVLQQGWIAYQVTQLSEKSSLQQIVYSIENELDKKTQYVRLADKIVQWFVPSVITIAFLVGVFCFIFGIADENKSVFETSILRSITVLLISCPCAIGIAAPLAESHLINQLSKLGIIVKNRGCLSLLGKVSTFVFDKTGTITEGLFTIQSGIEHLSNKHQKILYSLALCSNHPMSQAIVNSMFKNKPQFDENSEFVPYNIENIFEFHGKGICGSIDKVVYHLGSFQFMEQEGISIDKNFDYLFDRNSNETISSYVAFSGNFQLLAVIELRDRIREDAHELIPALGSTKSILLSGDQINTVQAVAKSCHFVNWEGLCSPLRKKSIIEKLRNEGEIVCMLGDGVNDAPSLAAAHIGISMYSATDISMQVSDLILSVNRLKILPKIRVLGKKGQRIIKQNLFWAFFYNVIGIGLAMFGYLSPIIAASAMILSSLIVLFNAQRIGRHCL